MRRISTTDIDAHTEQLLDWNLRYDQLDCGAFNGSFTDIRWPGVQLFVENTTRRIRQRGHLPQDSFAIGIMLEGQGPICINGRHGGANAMIAVHSAEFDACMPANCVLAGLVIDAKLVRAAASCAPELGELLQADTLLSVNTPGTSLASLRSLLLSVVESAFERPFILQDPVAQQRLRNDVLHHVVDAVAGPQRYDESRQAGGRKRVVDRACELLLASQDEPPTLLDVCNKLGASPRKLSYCFQDVLGLSPARYIKAVRLNAVRRELRGVSDPLTSVYDVAARWGFWHFGHFSADYKRQFAELPSDTLRRARA